MRPSLLQWKSHEKRASLSGLAFDPDVAPVGLDDASADKEPEPGARYAPHGRRVAPIELVENRSKLIRGDSDALVPHRQQHPEPVLRIRGDQVGRRERAGDEL